MAKLSVTALRKHLYRVIDEVLETGVPAEIERHGRTVLIVPGAGGRPKLARLESRTGIVGDPDTLVTEAVSEWTGADAEDPST